MEEEEGITDANDQTVITIPKDLLRGKPNSTKISGSIARVLHMELGLLVE